MSWTRAKVGPSLPMELSLPLARELNARRASVYGDWCTIDTVTSSLGSPSSSTPFFPTL